MAKRGYRGKHPHNDMKVSKHSKSTSKRSVKLDTEYNKLSSKQKYSYIRDNFRYIRFSGCNTNHYEYS